MLVQENNAKLKRHYERRVDKQRLSMIFPSGAAQGRKMFLEVYPSKNTHQ